MSDLGMREVKGDGVTLEITDGRFGMVEKV